TKGSTTKGTDPTPPRGRMPGSTRTRSTPTTMRTAAMRSTAVTGGTTATAITSRSSVGCSGSCWSSRCPSSASRRCSLTCSATPSRPSRACPGSPPSPAPSSTRGSGAPPSPAGCSGAGTVLALLIVIMLLGHWREMRSLAQTSSALDSLAALLPDEAERIEGDDLVTVAPDDLREGDLVLVRPGASVPADGTVVEGRADGDES